MPLTTDSPYQNDIYIVKQYGENTARVIFCSKLREAGWELLDDKRNKNKLVNTEKLDNNLARAKSRVRELALCNNWDYWCTFTVDAEKSNRYDLKEYFQDFAEFLHNYNRRCSDDEKVRYLLIPEKHKDGAWHIHGFIRGIRKKDLYTNQHGFLTWKQYEQKFGFISMSPIRDLEKTASYSLKYMMKDIDKNVTGRNAHLFYASKGLNGAVELYRGHAEFSGKWDYIDSEGFYKVKTIDLRKNDISEFLGGAT